MAAESKILLYVFFSAALFIFESLLLYIVLGIVLLFLLARIPFRSVRAGWLPISLFLLFTFFSNLVNRHGRIMFSQGPFLITEEGLALASIRAVRVFLMIAGVKVMMGGSRTEDIISGFGRLMRPLERLGIPAKDFFHTMGLTVQCFPALKKRAEEIYHQRVGKRPVRGFWEKAKVVSGFLMPMFVESMRSPEVFFTEGDHGENRL